MNQYININKLIYINNRLHAHTFKKAKSDVSLM